MLVDDLPDDVQLFISSAGKVKSVSHFDSVDEEREDVKITDVGVEMANELFMPVYDESWFTITYNDENKQKEALVTNVVATDESSMTVDIIFDELVDNRTEQNSVLLDDIISVSPVANPADYITIPEADLETKIQTIKRYSEISPRLVETNRVSWLLSEVTTPSQQSIVLHTVANLVNVYPEEGTQMLGELCSMLDSDEENIVEQAAYCFAEIATTSPREAVPYTHNLLVLLDHSNPDVREHVMKTLCAITYVNPAAVENHEQKIIARLEDNILSVRKYAALSTSYISESNPSRIERFIPNIVTALQSHEREEYEAIALTSAITHVVIEYPSAGVKYLDVFIELAESAPHHKTQTNLIGAVYEIAKVHTFAVKPYLSSISHYLTSEYAFSRKNAVGVFARVAADFPGEVSKHTDDLVICLTDPNDKVRLNACWTFGRIGEAPTSVKKKLESLAGNDENDRVKVRAAWAVKQIKNG